MRAESRVVFHTLVYKRRLHDTIVGRESTGSYLAVEETGVKIIKFLEAHTIGQTEHHFPKHDIRGFVKLLKSKGFVHKLDHRIVHSAKKISDVLHLDPKSVAWLHHPVVPAIAWAIVLLCFGIMLLYPSLVPVPSWFFSTGYLGVILPVAFIIFWVLHFLHEFAHYVMLRGTGHVAGFSIVHRWHFLLPYADVGSARLLPQNKRIHVYLAGLAIDFLVLAVSLVFILLGYGIGFWQLVALISFLSILFHFTPVYGSDVMLVTSHVLGIENINRVMLSVAKKCCIFCKHEDHTSDELRVARILPLYIVGVLLLLGLLIGYVFPILLGILVTPVKELLAAAAGQQSLLFVDSFIALLFVSVFVSFYFVSMLREHKLSEHDWFTWLCVLGFTLANYLVVFLIAVALLIYTQPVAATACLFFAGLVFGLLFLRLMDHIKMEKNSGVRDYFLPAVVGCSALFLLLMLGWIGAGAGLVRPEAIYAVAYAIGMLGAMVV